MNIQASQRRELKEHLRNFDFRKLFRELGWDRNPGELMLQIGDNTFTLQGIAEKRGFQVFLCNPPPSGQPPTQDMRKRLHRQLGKQAHEHLIIYVDGEQSMVTFSHPRREANKPLRISSTTWHKGQDGERVIQRLLMLYIAMDEEQGIVITDIINRASEAFNIDKVTKEFFRRFKQQHSNFLGFIRGIEDNADREWYASLMLNRIMFSYFIQKKGFLDGDQHYLRTRLRQCRQMVGRDKFHSFYRSFLLRLFHEGFDSDEHDPKLEQLIGKIPYLNGGLFEIHRLERDNDGIAISDKAFEKLFQFLDGYDWHLDARPNATDQEINPDILGFIFEQYINQKQMGAYYTKEDITEYISRNTVLPRLFDMVQDKCRIAFEGNHSIWRMLAEDPDDYIYPAMRHGISWDWHSQSPLEQEQELPPYICAGLQDITARRRWNDTAPEEYGLPTEKWRELVARHHRHNEVRSRLAAGQIASIDDLITCNLDIRQFAQNILQGTNSTDLLDAFWRALTSIRILDPTVGSGAFLFAALNILEPLYETALERMEQMLAEHRRANPDKPLRGKLKGFDQILSQIDSHSNREYYILKTIILSNLYGVDIMEEAVEICKLRLFLKLAARVQPDPQQPNYGLEPLPDIDFNIRAGNTLVGYVTEERAKAAITGDLARQSHWNRIKEDAEAVSMAFQMFQHQQTQHGVSARENRAAKQQLQTKIDELRGRLDRALAAGYNLRNTDARPQEFSNWLRLHKPFHWYIEFYAIMTAGGFDAVIGNPPYVRRTKIDYEIRDTSEHRFPDIYADVVVRSLGLMKSSGSAGMIVPISLTFGKRFSALRNALVHGCSAWFSSFDIRPSALFPSDIVQRCVIWIGRGGTSGHFVGPMRRWRSVHRDFLTQSFSFAKIAQEHLGFVLPKVPRSCEGAWRLLYLGQIRACSHRTMSGKEFLLGYSKTTGNFISTFKQGPPILRVVDMSATESSGTGWVGVACDDAIYACIAAWSGETLFLYWLVVGDGFHLMKKDIEGGMDLLSRVPDGHNGLLVRLGRLLHERRYESLVFTKYAGLYVGNFNYRRHHEITRRADMLLIAGLGGSREDVMAVFDYVQGLLCINESVGEKAIPEAVKRRFAPLPRNLRRERQLFREADRLIKDALGFTQQEIDWLCTKDPCITVMGGMADE